MITSKDTILYLNFFFLYDAFIFCQRDNQKNNLCSQMCMNIKL